MKLFLRQLGSELRFRLTGRPRRSVDPFLIKGEGAGVPGAVLSASPLIVATAATAEYPLGLASALGPSLADRDALFVVYSTWTSEGDPLRAWKAVQRIGFYRRRFPRHHILPLVNSEAEADLLRRFGGTPLLAHQNIFIDETVFRPLPGSVRDFDAVLNAKMTPFKRHTLASAVPRLAVIYYRDGLLQPADAEAYSASVRSALSHAVFANDLAGSPGEMMPRAEVNQWLNRAAVGLMLSAEEGGNFASTEYLLAGLPVVSTTSIGGRDRYFDPADCTVCAPDPRMIAEAAAALKARNIPPDRIRARVLRLIERDRTAFEAGVLAAARALPKGDNAAIDMARIKRLPEWRPLALVEAEIRSTT